jgi:hypothetical protein
MKKSPCDINGKIINIGCRVRVLSVSQDLMTSLPQDEIEDLKSFIGEIFEVYEIDERGGAWVEKVFEDNEKEFKTHSLRLSEYEMELIK